MAKITDVNGQPVMSDEEIKKRQQALVDGSSTESKRNLFGCDTSYDVQLLWAKGEVSTEDVTAWMLFNIAGDLRVLREFISGLSIVPKPR